MPRRSADITFAAAPFTLEFPPVVDLLLAGIGIGGTITSIAVLLFIAIAVKSVFFGEKLDLGRLTPGMSGVPQGVLRLPPQSHAGETAEVVHAAGAPGTIILVFVFLAVFILHYFANWKVLSMIWEIG